MTSEKPMDPVDSDLRWDADANGGAAEGNRWMNAESAYTVRGALVVVCANQIESIVLQVIICP